MEIEETEGQRERYTFDEVKLNISAEAELKKKNEKRFLVLNYSRVRKEQHSLLIMCKRSLF